MANKQQVWSISNVNFSSECKYKIMTICSLTFDLFSMKALKIWHFWTGYSISVRCIGCSSVIDCAFHSWLLHCLVTLNFDLSITVLQFRLHSASWELKIKIRTFAICLSSVIKPRLHMWTESDNWWACTLTSQLYKFSGSGISYQQNCQEVWKSCG